MTIFIKLVQVAFLYGFYLVGSWLQTVLHLPLPGSIIGLLLVWGALSTKLLSLNWIESGAYTLLSVLPIFFIPATVAIMNYGHFFAGKGSLLIPITIISTFLTMGIASFVSQSVAKRNGKRKAGSECS
ncbi:CidA/LrgA family protein [Sporosarcina gallistercoris]|uniref:CidA/LrgA family holin-like protein n=1 Tax=Sporosarcina gallistercoris TaxID=2762245 RepID=A0ABR8PIS4_9BACL|nr:CidA/LrgA family holin-like protein [Sporosarcina gallistercoris]MBD7908053.1 CidA/LrgA family holin-like protein [Sporosarcina gallistercoris]